MDLEVKQKFDTLYNQNLEILAMLRLICPFKQTETLFEIARRKDMARAAKKEARENANGRRD